MLSSNSLGFNSPWKLIRFPLVLLFFSSQIHSPKVDRSGETFLSGWSLPLIHPSTSSPSTRWVLLHSSRGNTSTLSPPSLDLWVCTSPSAPLAFIFIKILSRQNPPTLSYQLRRACKASRQVLKAQGAGKALSRVHLAREAVYGLSSCFYGNLGNCLLIGSYQVMDHTTWFSVPEFSIN